MTFTAAIGNVGSTQDVKLGTIAASIHPEYLVLADEWEKFRYIMRGGDEFIVKYVEKYTSAESDEDFQKRRRMTPLAGFAKSAIVDIQNAIFQRMSSIRRQGGSESYQQSVRGQLGGVDLYGSNMTHFIGTEILPELLSMGKVGIYVDNFKIEGRRTLSQKNKQHPYIYSFVAEDIRNWEFFVKGNELKLKQVLLRVRTETVDPEVNLVNELTDGFRHYWIAEDNTVWCVDYDAKGELLDGVTVEDAAIQLPTDEIPFHILELQSSLLVDIANHQIALTNLESADIGYALRSNLPVYTEQFDQKFEHAFNKGFADEDNNSEAAGEDGGNPQQRKIGSSDGVRYPIGADRPDFINPSSEPIQASMEKQKQLKDDIRVLVNLAASNVKPRFASAESKEMDERGLEAGLSAIGLVLEHAEKRVAEIWLQYEDSEELVTVHYPERYSLRSDAERRADAEQLAKSSSAVSSPTFRREVQKEIATILLGGKVADDALDAILEEISGTQHPTADPDQIRSDVEVGLVSRETASLARGYAEGEAAKAAEEKAKVEAERAEAQMAQAEANLSARGLDDDPEGARREKEESQNPENNPNGKRQVRGEGRNTQSGSEEE
jgi:hypothetical protein